MKLYRDYPVPSDRMGMLWALGSVKDLVIVEFGPEGTTRYLLESLKNYGCEAAAKIFTTMLDEDVVVLGDSSKLLKTLAEVDEKYSPEFIVVMDSSVASVIGIDTEGLCREYQSGIKAKLLPVTGGGLSGIWTDGLAAALKLLAGIAKGRSMTGGGFNILGCCADEFNHRAEAEEIVQLLQGLFGLKTNCILSAKTSLADCKTMGNAEINIVLRREALAAAQQLQEKFAIPYVYSRPYGLEGTRRWVKQIEEAAEREANWESLAGIMAELKKLIAEAKAAAGFQSPTAVVMGGHPDTVTGLRPFLADELGLPVRCYSTVPGDDGYRTEKEGRKLVTADAALVVADGLNLRLVKHPGRICSAYPALDGMYAEQPALMGFNGAIYIIKTLLNSFKAKQEG